MQNSPTLFSKHILNIFIFILYPILMRNFIELSKPKTTFINLNWNLRYLADFI